MSTKMRIEDPQESNTDDLITYVFPRDSTIHYTRKK